jgi:hypothetical protein
LIATVISVEIPPSGRPPDLSCDTDCYFETANKSVTFDEVLNIISDLKGKKSEDLNGLSMYFIKLVSHSIIIPLSHIFNLSLSNPYVPSQMKIAKIEPIFKPGDALSTRMDNYRPISLLSCFSKILEKLMCNRLVEYLESNNLINPNQYGFREKHSTLHPLVHFLNAISSASNEKKVSIAIFCDLCT